jgi:hypothetical protein
MCEAMTLRDSSCQAKSVFSQVRSSSQTPAGRPPLALTRKTISITITYSFYATEKELDGI